jgi:hypothetical protein
MSLSWSRPRHPELAQQPLIEWGSLIKHHLSIKGAGLVSGSLTNGSMCKDIKLVIPACC